MNICYKKAYCDEIKKKIMRIFWIIQKFTFILRHQKFKIIIYNLVQLWK